MNSHNQKLLTTIQDFCREYLERKIDLATLESSISAVHSNFENDLDEKIKEKIFRFIVSLDNVYYLHNNEEHFELVKDKIKSLNSVLEVALKKMDDEQIN